MNDTYISPRGKVQSRSRKRASAAKRYKANPTKAQEQSRSYRLMSGYGLTIEEFEEINARQNGKCSICGCIPRKTRLCVNHDHRRAKSGEKEDKKASVTGLICSRDNRGLGAFHDSQRRIQSASGHLGVWLWGRLLQGDSLEQLGLASLRD